MLAYLAGGYVLLGVFFFFKQRTAYGFLSGAWGSDVCSPNLARLDQVWFFTMGIGLPVNGITH